MGKYKQTVCLSLSSLKNSEKKNNKIMETVEQQSMHLFGQNVIDDYSTIFN